MDQWINLTPIYELPSAWTSPCIAKFHPLVAAAGLFYISFPPKKKNFWAGWLMMNRLWGSSRCCPCRPSWVPVKSLTVLRSICDRLYCKANVMQSTSTVVPLDFLSLLALGGHGVLYSHIPFHILHRPQHVHFLFFVSFTNSYISFSLTIYLFSYKYISVYYYYYYTIFSSCNIPSCFL